MFSSNTDSFGYQSFKGASWALVSGLHLGDTIKGLILVLGPLFNPDIWACILDRRTYYFKPHQYQIPYEIIWNLMKPNKKSYIYVRNVCNV